MEPWVEAVMQLRTGFVVGLLSVNAVRVAGRR